MAQLTKRRHSLSSDYDSEPECTPLKKSSNRRATYEDSLNEMNERVFNQITLQTHINMDIIEGKQKNDADKYKQKEQRNEMIKNICALRNSGGGVLIVHITGDSEGSYNNKFHNVFDDMFKEYLFEDEEFSEVFQFSYRKDSIIIFVLGSNKIITTETNTRVSIPKGTENLKGQRLFNYFPLHKCKPPVIRSKWTESYYGHRYPKEEGANLQFKSCSNVTSFQNFKTTLKTQIEIYVSAFTKTKDGGSILWGIEEKKSKSNTIPFVLGLGIRLSENQVKHLYEFFTQILTQNMLWLENGCKILTPNKIKKYYNINFHLLSGTNERKHVIELSVAHFEGIVFQSKEGPTAWKVNKNKVCKISLEDWFSLMNKDAAEDAFKNSETTEVFKRFEDLSIQGSNLNTPKVFQINSSLTDITDSLFRMRKPMTLTPEAIVENLKNEGKMAEAFEMLKSYKAFRKNRCIAIVQYNFSVLLKEDEDSPLQSCNDCEFLCDVLIIGPDPLPLLTSFCKICDDHTNCMLQCDTHNHRITEILTFKLRSYICGLIGILSYTIDIGDNIQSQLNKCLEQENFYPDPTRKLEAEDILRAFVKVVASIPSPLRNIIDDFFLRSIMKNVINMQTLEQYQILYNDFPVKNRLLVHGFPGTGKTEVIKEAIRMLSKSNFNNQEILFVAENIPICDVIRKMGLCTTLTRYELDEMWSNNRENLMKIVHVFVDDAQFLSEECINWYEKLYNLMISKVTGKFWIFFGNHQTRRGPTVQQVIGKDIALFERRSLRSIIRNTKRIAEFAMNFADDGEYTDAVGSIPHDAVGEKVSIIYNDVSTEQARYNVFEYQMKKYLKSYKASSIAVLFSKVNDIPTELKKESKSFRQKVGVGLKYCDKSKAIFVKIPEHGALKIVNASRNNAKDAVVVDSVRRYASLDRLVVIVIGCEFSWQSIEYAAFTRPLVKLIVIRNRFNDIHF